MTVALHLDPSIERDIKLKPIHTKEERKEILMAFEDVDDVVYYEVEDQFLNYLKSGEYHIRFLGTDYIMPFIIKTINLLNHKWNWL